ncbi:hypothetical protein RMQ97_09210 [Maricaulis sp. D1M11]
MAIIAVVVLAPLGTGCAVNGRGLAVTEVTRLEEGTRLDVRSFGGLVSRSGGTEWTLGYRHDTLLYADQLDLPDACETGCFNQATPEDALASDRLSVGVRLGLSPILRGLTIGIERVYLHQQSIHDTRCVRILYHHDQPELTHVQEGENCDEF